MPTGLPPIIDEHATVLILGSLPGEESLRRQQYYGHPRNQFWPILYGLFGRQPDADYAARVAFAHSKGIALWDVFAAADREGSLDAAIKNAVPNNIGQLLRDYPHIAAIAVGGGTAQKAFERQVQPGLPRQVAYLPLPSPSPMHTRALAEKIAAWRAILPYLPATNAR